MLSSSDSDSLPEVGELIASQEVPVLNLRNKPGNNGKRKRLPATPSQASRNAASSQQNRTSSSRPRKKRKLKNGQGNGTARATSSVELSFDEEPQRPPITLKQRPRTSVAKNNHKPVLSEVIDLCSDSENVPSCSTRSQKRYSEQPPRDEDIIDLLSSDSEARVTLHGSHNGVHPKSPPMSAHIGIFNTALQVEQQGNEKGKTPIDTANISQVNVGPRPPSSPRRNSGSLSPVPLVHEIPGPTSPPPVGPGLKDAEIDGPPLPDSMPEKLAVCLRSTPQKAPCPEDPPSSFSPFSPKRNLKPHPATELANFEPFNPDMATPPLLTASYFTRAKQAQISSPIPSGDPKYSETASPLQNKSVKLTSIACLMTSSLVVHSGRDHSKEASNTDPTGVGTTTEERTSEAALSDIQPGSPLLSPRLSNDMAVSDSHPDTAEPTSTTHSEDTSHTISTVVNVKSLTRKTGPRNELTLPLESAGMPAGNICKASERPAPVRDDEIQLEDMASKTQAGLPQTLNSQILLNETDEHSETLDTEDAVVVSHRFGDMPNEDEIHRSPSPPPMATTLATVAVQRQSPVNLAPLQGSRDKETTPVFTIPTRSDLEEVNAEPRTSSELRLQPIGEKSRDGQHVAEPQGSSPEPDSAQDIKEIADMLLPQSSCVELTDEELLAIGLHYPDPDLV